MAEDGNDGWVLAVVLIFGVAGLYWYFVQSSDTVACTIDTDCGVRACDNGQCFDAKCSMGKCVWDVQTTTTTLRPTSGACTSVPDACTAEFLQVCGSNGITYSNGCVACQGGVSSWTLGKCPDAPEYVIMNGFNDSGDEI